MRIFIIFSVFCMIEVLRAEPITGEIDRDIVISKSFFNESYVIYEAKHDIVEILILFKFFNFDNPYAGLIPDDYQERLEKNKIIFFVEADIQNGNRVDQGLYVFKNEQAKNILPSGRTAAMSDKEHVFFGASDGLFAYDGVTNSAVKYGPIADGIISMAIANQHIIYIVTDDHKLYKVSNNGETKDLISNIEDAQEIILDDYDNIYYYNSNKEVFIRTANGVIQVQDLPPNPKSLKFVTKRFLIGDVVELMVNFSLYYIYPNGTSQVGTLQFSPDTRPTAYDISSFYFAFNKKLYNCRLLPLKDAMYQDES